MIDHAITGNIRSRRTSSCASLVVVSSSSLPSPSTFPSPFTRCTSRVSLLLLSAVFVLFIENVVSITGPNSIRLQPTSPTASRSRSPLSSSFIYPRRHHFAATTHKKTILPVRSPIKYNIRIKSRTLVAAMSSSENQYDDSVPGQGDSTFCGHETLEPLRFNDDDGDRGTTTTTTTTTGIAGKTVIIPINSNNDSTTTTTTTTNDKISFPETNATIIIEEEETTTAITDDTVKNNSEQFKPKRGRPGIVVFSGGTAFNAAAAEMASRNVGCNIMNSNSQIDGGGNVAESEDANTNLWRLNSWESAVDMMIPVSNDQADAKPNISSQNVIRNKSNSINNNNNIVAGGTKVWHVLPVTDDGGSTAEIVRVLGGPAVGDIRSRLLRLAPGTTAEARAVRRLLGHRLVSMESLKRKGMDCEEITPEMISRMAREEWLDLLDGGHESYKDSYGIEEGYDSEEVGSTNEDQCGSHEHPLWQGVSAPYRSIIRSFLVHFHTQVLQTHNGLRPSASNPQFDFTGGSIGNFFFAGARTFFGSLPAAIFLFSKVAGIPSGSRVIPAVLTEERLVLGACLKDGTRIRGQYNISHPHPKLPSPQNLSKTQTNGKASSPSLKHDGKDGESAQRDRSGSTSSGRHRTVVKSGIDTQEAISSLHPSPMSRVTYLLHDPTWRRRHNVTPQRQSSTDSLAPMQVGKPKLEWSDRHEIFPEPNPLVLDAISNANCIVYGCGSLFTSVLPSLVLEGVGQAIAHLDDAVDGNSGQVPHIPRVLLLNGWHDRETTWSEKSNSNDGSLKVKRMDATMFVKAVVDALDQGCIRSGLFSDCDFEIDGERNEAEYDAAGFVGDDIKSGVTEDNGDFGSAAIPSVTDYITHILYPIGTEIDIDEQSLREFCLSRQKVRERQLKHGGRLSQSREVSLSDEQNSPSKSNPSDQDSRASHVATGDGITVIGIPSIPANKCSDGRRSGGRSHLRVFDPRALVDALLDLANGGNGIVDGHNVKTVVN